MGGGAVDSWRGSRSCTTLATFGATVPSHVHVRSGVLLLWQLVVFERRGCEFSARRWRGNVVICWRDRIL